jgi:hypothetical protein
MEGDNKSAVADETVVESERKETIRGDRLGLTGVHLLRRNTAIHPLHWWGGSQWKHSIDELGRI